MADAGWHGSDGKMEAALSARDVHKESASSQPEGKAAEKLLVRFEWFLQFGCPYHDGDDADHADALKDHSCYRIRVPKT